MMAIHPSKFYRSLTFLCNEMDNGSMIYSFDRDSTKSHYIEYMFSIPLQQAFKTRKIGSWIDIMSWVITSLKGTTQKLLRVDSTK